MLHLVFHSIWHGIISAITWVRTTDYRATGDLWIAYVDHVAFYIFIGIFITMHIIVIIWFLCVPYKYRKEMKRNDVRYRTQVLEIMKNRDNHTVRKRIQEFSSTDDHIAMDEF